MNIFWVISLFAIIAMVIGREIYLLSSKIRQAFQTRKTLNQSITQKYQQGRFLYHLCISAFIYQSYSDRVEQLLDEIEGALNWRIIAFWDFNETEQALFYRSQRGLSAKFVKSIHENFRDRVEIGSVAAGRAISTRQPLIINNWHKDPHLKGLDFLSEFGAVNSLGIFPVASRLKTYGNLHVFGETLNQFKLNEVQFFATVVNSFAAILDNDELARRSG